MTWAQLIDAATTLTKIGVPATSELVGVAEVALQRCWSEIIESRPIDEFLRNRVKPTLTTIVADLGVVTVTTLNLLLLVKEVRFSNLTTEWTLVDEMQRVRPSGVEGKPRAWRRVGRDQVTPALGDRIFIEPYGTIIPVDDKLIVTYYERPPLLAATASGAAPNQVYVAGTDSVTNKFDTELVDRVTAYVLIHLKKIDQAEAMMSKYKNPTPPQSAQ